MGRFSFEAINSAGTTVRGQLEAHSKAAALESLMSSGQVPVTIRDADHGAQAWLARLPRPRSGADELVTFASELATLLSSGLTVERALVVLQGLATSQRRALRTGQILARVRGGTPLSGAIEIVLPPGNQHLANLIAAGELSGHLPEVMSRLASSLKRARALRGKVLSSLTYPAFLVATMIAVLWIVFTSVLPRLVPMFESARAALPMPTAMLVSLSHFIDAYGEIAMITAFFLVPVAIAAFRREEVRLRWDRFTMSTTLLLGIPREYEAARFCRNLETLLNGGLSLDRALEAARMSASNRWFKDRLLTVLDAVKNGARLRQAFANAEVAPAIVVEFASVGEETGRLAAMMREAADVLEQGVETRLDRLTTLVLPVATLVMGLLIAGVMAGIVAGLLAVNDLGT